MARGGLAKMRIDFSKVKDRTLGDVFGTKPVPVTDLSKRLWELIKKERLQLKTE